MAGAIETAGERTPGTGLREPQGLGLCGGAGENRKWTAHTPEQTDQSPHRDLSEYSRANETVSNGEFVNSLLDT